MKLFSKTFAIISALATVRVVAGTAIEGYADGLMGFSGTIGDFPIVANGTAQSIFNQAQTLHPSIAQPGNFSIVARGVLEERTNVQGHFCVPVPGKDWYNCYIGTIKDGISYLNGLSGLCGVDSRTCVRISCNYDAAIYWCNDAYYWRQGECSYLAEYASLLIDWCKSGDYVGGQVFDYDSWNIIVRSDEC